MMADPLSECQGCGGQVRRLISRNGMISFKGGGFYVTDQAVKDSPSVSEPVTGQAVKESKSVSESSGAKVSPSSSSCEKTSKD